MTEQKENKLVKPKYKVTKQEDKLKIAVALPGVNKSQISVKAEKGIVTVSAERAKVSQETWNLIAGGPEFDAYELKLRVGFEYDLEKTEAKFEKNILLLFVPLVATKQLSLEVQ
jgi:HSP20 family molecular chaperone IbpA